MKKESLTKIVGLSIIFMFVGGIILPNVSANFLDSRDIFNRLKKDRDLPKLEKVIDEIKSRNGEWVPIETVSTESSRSFWPTVRVDNENTTHVIWADGTNYDESGYDADIFYKYKTSDGDWSLTEVVTTESTQHSEVSSMAIDSENNVHIVWEEENFYGGSGNDIDIFYKMKINGGSWTTTEVVSTESVNESFFPCITVDFEGTVHVSWTEFYEGISENEAYIIYKQKAVDGSWNDFATEIVSIESNSSYYSSIDKDDLGNIHVAWIDFYNIDELEEDIDIFYKKRSSNNAWTDAELVSTESFNESSWPSLAVESNGAVHLVWDEFTESWDSYVSYKHKSSDGQWSDTELVSTESSDWAFLPCIDVGDDSTAHIAWIDYSEYGGSGWDSDIFYKKRTSDGTWSISEVVSTSSYFESRDPSIAVDSNNLAHVVWDEQIDEYYEEVDILYRKQNQPPETPETPSGETTGVVGIEYNFSTITSDPGGDQIKYGWDWDGDSNVDEWTELFDSNVTVETSHSWESAGTYEISVKAKDQYGAESGWSDSLTIVIENDPPETPNQPSGVTEGEPGIEYNFTTNSIDPEGHQIQYGWDWDGDLNVDLWTDLVDSGVTVEVTHLWENAGTYEISVKAKDQYGAESDWSDPLTIDIKGARLEITEITGGMGVSATIKNTGDAPVKNLKWNLQVMGGFLGWIDADIDGNTSELDVDKTETAATGSLGFLNLGGLEIIVTAEADNAEKVTMEATAFIFGPFVLNVKLAG